MASPARAAVNLAATGAVVIGNGRLIGIFVTTSSSLTLKLWDGLSAAGNVVLPTTAAITAPAFYGFSADFQTGLFCTFGGTGTVTFVYERN